MTSTLDTIIAFVVVMLGLSMTVQLLTDLVKGALGLRWKVYAGFVQQLYVEHLEKDEKRDIKLGTAPKGMQSVAERLRDFASNLKTYWQTAGHVRIELVAIQTALRDDQKTADQKIAFLVERAESHAPTLTALFERLRSIPVASLLALYQQLPDRPRLEARPASGQDTASKSATEKGGNEKKAESLSDQEVSLFAALEVFIDLFAGAGTVKDVKEKTLSEIESILAQVLDQITKMEARVRGIHARLEANFDAAVARLQRSYAQNMKWWCFGIALVFCLAINADAINIYKTLERSPTLTQRVIADRDQLAAVMNSSLNPTTNLNELYDAKEALAKDWGAAFDVWKQSFDGIAKALRAYLRLLTGGDEAEAAEATRAAKSLTKAEKHRDAAEAATGKERLSEVEAATNALTSAAFYTEVERATGRIDALLDGSLPLGWNGFPDRFGDFLLWLVGILAAAFGISFGAPVWNDLLKALLGIRSRMRSPAAGTQ